MSCWCFVFSPRTYVSVFVTFMSWTLLFKPNEWMNELTAQCCERAPASSWAFCTVQYAQVCRAATTTAPRVGRQWRAVTDGVSARPVAWRPIVSTVSATMRNSSATTACRASTSAYTSAVLVWTSWCNFIFYSLFTGLIKPVANNRKRKENLTNLSTEKRTVLTTLSHTSHNIITTLYKSLFIMKIEKQKNDTA